MDQLYRHRRLGYEAWVFGRDRTWVWYWSRGRNWRLTHKEFEKAYA